MASNARRWRDLNSQERRFILRLESRADFLANLIAQRVSSTVTETEGAASYNPPSKKLSFERSELAALRWAIETITGTVSPRHAVAPQRHGGGRTASR